MDGVVRPGRYRHFKGREYRVLGVARHSETLEEYVVYQALYGERGLWTPEDLAITRGIEAPAPLETFNA